MFEVMASVLPPYRQIYIICKQRMDGSDADINDQRLATLMSYAYADVVRMCLDIYHVFLRNNHGKPILLPTISSLQSVQLARLAHAIRYNTTDLSRMTHPTGILVTSSVFVTQS